MVLKRIGSLNMKGDKSSLLFLIFLALVHGRRVRNPCPLGEVPCDNGECINRFDWCGVKVVCTDGSDEKYRGRYGLVNEPVKHVCTDKHFTCEDGMCVPASARCDFEFDCYDRSDEQNCETFDQEESLYPSEKEPVYFSTTSTSAEKREIGTTTFPTSISSTPAHRREIYTSTFPTSTDNSWRTTSTPTQRREISTTALPTSADLINILRTTNTPARRRDSFTTALPTSTDFYDSSRTTSTPAQRREIFTTALPTSTDFYDSPRTTSTPTQKREISTTALPTSIDFYDSSRTASTPAQRREIFTTALPISTEFYDSSRTTSTPAQRREISTAAVPTSTDSYDNWRTEETHNNIMRHYYTPPLSNTHDPYAPPPIVNPNYNRGIPFYPRYPEQTNNRRSSDTFRGENFPNNLQPHVRETTSHGRPYIYTPPTTITFRQNPFTPDYPYAGQEIPQVRPLRSILYPPRTTLIVSLHRNVRRPDYFPFYFANSYTPDFERKYRADIRNVKDGSLRQRDASYGWDRVMPRGVNALSPFSDSFQSDVEDIEMMRKSLRTHLGIKRGVNELVPNDGDELILLYQSEF